MWSNNRIRHIVRLSQMLKRWRKKATSSHSPPPPPSDVPPGHVAVSVGINGTRFILRATHLNHPVFKTLLVKEARDEFEFGFDNYEGPLFIPCDVATFLDALRLVDLSPPPSRHCRVSESLEIPLLRTIPENSVY